MMPALSVPLGTEREESRESNACSHCGQAIPNGRRDSYCCRGCRTVAQLIQASGLERYYDLRRGPGVPVGETGDAPRDRKWLESTLTRVTASASPTRVSLDLQGVHCSACVWLIESVFQREGAGATIEINPALGRAEIRLDATYPLTRFVEAVESFGYRVGPATDTPEQQASDGLLVRAGICLALAGNAMLLSAAIHLGLRTGPLYAWANDLSFGAAIIAMAIGAPVFVQSAWAGIRRGVLHLDLPIAVGMGLALAGSIHSYVTRGGSNYVDTLTAFVALMLVGRWLQTRVLERNQRELLRDPGYEGVLCRRVAEGRTELVPCSSIEARDVLLVSPGDLVPVRAVLIDAVASFSLDWIDGESRPRSFASGDEIPSGAVLLSDAAVRVRADEGFSVSEVSSLLAGTRHEPVRERSLAGIPKNIGGVYVIFVFVASAAAGLSAWLIHHDLTRALEATIAALVVTCPCAFGIAVPLAYELVQTRLRRRGVFVRRPSLFERALDVRTVVFDKTGTLTTGRLAVDEPERVLALAPELRQALYDLTARSNHPKSRAVAEVLEALCDARIDASAEVREVRGCGLETVRDGRLVRVGSPSWALADVELARELTGAQRDVVLSRDGALILALATTEQLRVEARAEIANLALSGRDIYMLSGDSPERCIEVAELLGIAGDHVLSGQTAAEKESFILAAGPSSVLMVGDGLNDARALAAAGCAGTPSIERPFTASRCDFYFVSPGIEPIAQVLRSSQRLAQVVRADLAIALVYNVFAVALCGSGLMHPWLAAILMPASSLGTIAFTVLALRDGGFRWKS